MLPRGNTFGLFSSSRSVGRCQFLSVMDEIQKVLDGLEKSVRLLQDQMDSMKRASEVPVSRAKSPERSSPSASRGDKVPSWADRMELETEALTQPGDEIRPVKVREDTELLLQRAFTPLKNPDRRALRCHFLVPDSPVTMAPKLDKVMAAECLPGVRSTDQSLQACLQALMLNAVGPLTDLLEKMGNSEDGNEETLDFQVVEDTIQSALAFLGNAATQFSIYRRTKILEEYNKELVSFSEELEPELRAAAPLLFGPSFTKQHMK